MSKTRKKRVTKKKVTKKAAKKTNKKGTRKSNSKINKMIQMFKQYPNIFPRGYFSFLKKNLEEKIQKKSIIFKNGVILTWIQYKKLPSKFKTFGIEVGDIKINQLVNKNEGNGEAKKIFLDFLKKHKNKNIILDVKKDNHRAIRFYKKNGFKKVGNTSFGEYPGIIMKKKQHHIKMTGGKKSSNAG